MLNIKKNLYRPEIDGLRAFAVIAVIINHFNNKLLPSGYLGVDIFFVISGFVITSSLSDKRVNNFFQFINGFYARRVKRILPSLIFYVLLMSILICFFSYEPQTSLRTGISSLFGLSNVYLFVRSTDYFSHSANLNPFTNTWSLGVEEQFYFIFPFFLWFSGFIKNKKKAFRNLSITLLIAISISGLLFINQYSINQSSAYFLLHNRFWEIAFGSLVFLQIKKDFLKINRLRNIIPFLILILIILVMFQPLSRGLYSTFIIVFLTGVLIILLKKDSTLKKILSKKEIVKIGKLSYSLYLWHWGILSISYLTIGIHWWSIPFQLIVIYILSIFSFNYIENPLRNKKWPLKNFRIIIYAFLSLFFSAISIYILDSKFKENLYLGNKNLSLKKPYFKYYSLDEKYCFIYNDNKDYRIERIFSRCSKQKNKNYAQTLFFLGDSYTRAFWLGADYIAKKTNSRIFTLSAPQTPFPTNKYQNREQTIYSKRSKIFDLLEKEIKFNIENGDVVFLNNYLGGYEDDFSKKEFFVGWLKSLDNFVVSLANKNVKVVIFMPTPIFSEVTDKRCRNFNPQWFNKYSTEDCSYIKLKEDFVSEDGKYRNIINQLVKLSSLNDNLYVFDSLGVMCPNSECKYTSGVNPLYSDQHHLSNYSARYLMAPKVINFLREKRIISF